MPSLALSLDASACTVASRQSIYLHLHRTPQLALQLKSKNKQNLWHEQQQTCDKQYLWLPVQSTDYGLNLSNNARLIAIKTNKCLSASDTLTQVFFYFLCSRSLRFHSAQITTESNEMMRSGCTIVFSFLRSLGHTISAGLLSDTSARPSILLCMSHRRMFTLAIW